MHKSTNGSASTLFSQTCSMLSSSVYIYDEKGFIHLWNQLARFWSQYMGHNMTNNISLLPITRSVVPVVCSKSLIGHSVEKTFCLCRFLCSSASCGNKLFLEFIFLSYFSSSTPSSFVLSFPPLRSPSCVLKIMENLLPYLSSVTLSDEQFWSLTLLFMAVVKQKKSRSPKCLHQRVNSLTCGSVTKL